MRICYAIGYRFKSTFTYTFTCSGNIHLHVLLHIYVHTWYPQHVHICILYIFYTCVVDWFVGVYGHPTVPSTSTPGPHEARRPGCAEHRSLVLGRSTGDCAGCGFWTEVEGYYCLIIISKVNQCDQWVWFMIIMIINYDIDDITMKNSCGSCRPCWVSQFYCQVAMGQY